MLNSSMEGTAALAKKVLLVKMSSLGDVVHALPAVTEAARVGVRFHWVVEEAYRAVAAGHPAVERVLPIAWRRWRRSLWNSRRELRSFFQNLAGEHYDVVIDAQGLLKSALVTSRVRAVEAVGFCGKSAREPLAARFYDRRIEVDVGQHAVERQRRLFAGALGYTCDAGAAVDFGLGRERAQEQRCVFLHGTTWDTKLWPETMWVELARLADAAGLRVVLPWGNSEERARAERIAARGGAALLPPLGLAELMGELRRARLAVGVDSGLAHLASALGTPTVVVYGSTSSALTGCRGDSARNLQAEFACAPCLSRTCSYRGPASRWRGTVVTPPCYGVLGPDSVWAAALELMDADSLPHV